MSIWNIFKRKKSRVMKFAPQIIRRLNESGLVDMKESETRSGKRAITLLIFNLDFPYILFRLGTETKYPALMHHSNLISTFAYFNIDDDVFTWERGTDGYNFYGNPTAPLDIIIEKKVNDEYDAFIEEVRMMTHDVVREITGVDLPWRHISDRESATNTT